MLLSPGRRHTRNEKKKQSVGIYTMSQGNV
jgi:hypothetical protein